MVRRGYQVARAFHMEVVKERVSVGLLFTAAASDPGPKRSTSSILLQGRQNGSCA